MNNRAIRANLLLSSVLAASFTMVPVALAQDAENVSTGLQEIIVTAQKREQSVQDVPIAVTALSQDTLTANRVVSVNDLNGLAPGVTVRPTAGGQQIPSFSIRGAVSTGVVPGSDKQVSIYLDGVYISSPRGSIFDLPDVARIEMLRGPQGTLFGRNATAGAVSVTTRDPSGEAHIRAEAGIGNLDQARFRITADLPQMGPFSAYGSFVHQYRRGEMRNLQAGLVWDRRASPGGDVRISPKWLGTLKSDSYFAAVKFEPSDNFSTVYKFDKSVSDNTPAGAGFVGYDPTVPLIGGLVDAIIKGQTGPVTINSSAKRPKAVNNGFATRTDQKIEGHSLTSNLRLSDSVTVRNILAYRKSNIFSPAPIDGVAGLPFTAQAIGPFATLIAFTDPRFAALTQAQKVAMIPTIAGGLGPLVGQPFALFASTADGHSKQWSDELQVNYDSELLTLTTGALWFKSKDRAGSLPNLQNTIQFAPIFGGVLTPGNQGVSYNKATSIAAYGQLEVHLSPQLDIVAGGRWTRDKKSGAFHTGTIAVPVIKSFTYKKSKPTFLLGVNYKPADHTLLYAKYSTAFVSGGSVAGIAFAPETAKSWEAGVKADLFDRRLRTNLSLFHVTYSNVQGATSPQTYIGAGQIPDGADPAVFPFLGVFVAEQGDYKARGFEFEGTALVTDGLTAGGSLSYTKTTAKNVPPILIAAGQDLLGQRPKWTGSLWGQYESEPFAGDATFSLRVDGQWNSAYHIDLKANRGVAAYANITDSNPHWIVNGRAAIKNISLGPVKTELAVWARNLLDNKDATYALIFGGINAAANYQQARAFGVDLAIDF